MKKLLRNLTLSIMIATLTIAGLSVSDMNPIVRVEAASVKINAKTKTIYKGKTATLKVTGTKSKVTWSSSNKKIATVSSKGKVTAKNAGKCTITAKVSGKKYTCKVTVKNPTLSKSSVSLNKGKTTNLKVTGGSSIKWSSSNKNVATVTSKGKITAKGKGTCYVYAKTSGVTLKCKVTVTIPATSIKLNATSGSVNVGSSVTLTATISPSNVSNKTVTWSSSNTSVATVSGGKVTGKKAGTATITAKTNNGKTATYKVTVKDVSASSVSLNKTSLSLNVGSSSTLTATVNPSNTTNKAVTWSSSNTAVATVSGGKVTGRSSGIATITVKTVNGKTATCKVTVTQSDVIITGVNISNTSLSLEAGSTKKITASVVPSNTTMSKTISWTTSNSSVATVSSDGTIKAISKGTAYIYADAVNGKYAYCVVSVTDKQPTSISLDKTSSTLKVKDYVTLYVSFAPSGSSSGVTWTTSDSDVVKLSPSATQADVRALKVGTATITAKTDNGKTATCKITVTPESTNISSIKLDKNSLSLYENQTERIVVTPTYTNGKTSLNSTDLVVSVSDTSVITTSFDNTSTISITAKKNGTTTLTVATADGVAKATCQITVKKFEAQYTYTNLEILNTQTIYSNPKKENKDPQTVYVYYESDWLIDNAIGERSPYIEVSDGKRHQLTGMIGTPLDVHYKSGDTYKYSNSLLLGSIIETNRSDRLGEMVCLEFSDPGTYTINLYEALRTDYKNIKVKVGSINVTVKDYEAAEKEWQNSLLNKLIDDSMSDYTKMNTIANYMSNNAKYGTTDSKLNQISLISHDTAYFDNYEFGCETATEMMIGFADMLGIKATSLVKSEPSSPTGIHVVCIATINGQEYEFDACPNGYTNIIKEWDYIK